MKIFSLVLTYLLCRLIESWIFINLVFAGEYLIPAGCNIILLLYGMHHNPRIYPNPWVYDPDRFLPDEIRGRHPYAYIPFSAGSRNCIGF